MCIRLPYEVTSHRPRPPKNAGSRDAITEGLGCTMGPGAVARGCSEQCYKRGRFRGDEMAASSDGLPLSMRKKDIFFVACFSFFAFSSFFSASRRPDYSSKLRGRAQALRRSALASASMFSPCDRTMRSKSHSRMRSRERFAARLFFHPI